MARALVLGGGGPVGVAWEAGLIVGWAEGGVDVATAELVSGTSAGSVVGAAVRLGLDLEPTLALVETPPGDLSSMAGLERMYAELTRAATEGTSAGELRVRLGRVARETTTMDEEQWVESFAVLAGKSWPAGFQCTAVDVDSGELRVWDAAGGAPLERAVASSCAVPGVFPPVTIDGRMYMDGGMRTALNADLAAGSDIAVAVSCFAFELPPGFSDPMAEMINAEGRADLARLRESGTQLELVEPGPEFLELSGWGLNLLDFSLAREAFAVGRRQADAEIERLAAAWANGD